LPQPQLFLNAAAFTHQTRTRAAGAIIAPDSSGNGAALANRIVSRYSETAQRGAALTLFWEFIDRMKRLRRIAIFLTAISAFSCFVVANTGLALPQIDASGKRPPCYPLFELPFTDYFFPLPLWMWGSLPLVFLVSTVAALGLWIRLAVKWRSRRALTSAP
jgi:hypothetical protein